MNKTPNLILASGSQARRNMLMAVGLSFDTIPADIDEQSLMNHFLDQNSQITEITEELACAKALHVSEQHLDSFVIGSDQTLEFEGQLLSKACDENEAREKLCMLRGKTHLLHSSVCVMHKGRKVFLYTDTARLTMHDFDDQFLDKYMTKNADVLVSCVGSYDIEGLGAWVFEDVQGDHYTVMGMPLLPLLSFLREKGKIFND